MASRTQRAMAALALVLFCHQCGVHSDIALKDPATDPELVKIAELTAMLATPAPADSVAQGCTPAGYQYVATGLRSAAGHLAT